MTNKKSTKLDILKTGPMTYRQLQAENQAMQSGVRPEFLSFLNDLDRTYQPRSLYDARSHAPQDVMSPLTQQTTRLGNQDYWGNSFFDPKNATEYQFQNLSDVRAENQPWYSKLLNGIGKAGVLAGTTALETAGLLYGAGHSLLETAGAIEDNGQSWVQDLWDNPITNALQKVTEASEEYMPNYYTQDELENPFSNIFTANFLGDKLLKNLGFMVGAFYGGIPASKLIGTVGKAAVKSARAASLAERAGMASRVGELTAGYADDVLGKVGQYEREIRGLSKEAAAGIGAKYGDDVTGLYRKLAAEGLTEAERGKKILEGFDKVRNAAQTTRATTQTIGALGSAINEGAIEALNNSKDWANLAIKEENDRYQNELAEELGKIEMSLGDTERGEAEKIKKRIELAQKHEKQLVEIEKGRARVGNADLLLNIPILMASNMYQLGKLYTRGFDSTRRQLGSIWNGHRLEGSLAKGTLKSSKTSKGAIASALWKSNTEGLEEYLQRAASDGAGEAVNESIRRFMEAGQSGEATNNVDDYLVGFGKAIADNLGNPNAWEEYMIGALSSMVGMPVFGSQTKNAYMKLGPVGFAGGLRGNYKDYTDARDRENKVAEYLNTHVQDYQNFRRGPEETIADYLHRRVNDPKFKALYQYLKVESDYDKWLQEQIEAGDKSNYKDLEVEEFYKFLNAAASSGHLEEFKQLVGYNTEYSDEELEDIVKQTSKKITSEQQRKQDENRAAELKGMIEASTEQKKDALVEDYTKELEEVNARLAQDDASKTDNSVESPYKERLEGPFIDRNGQMNVTNPEKMREVLTRNKENLLQGIDDYLKIRNDIDIETDGRLDDDQIELLTLMRGKILSYDKRSAEMAYDLIKNLQGVKETQGAWREKISKDLEKAQQKYDSVSKSLEDAKKRNAKKKEIEGLEKDKVTAEKELNKAKAVSRAAGNVINLLEMLTEEKSTTAAERAAYAKGRGDNWLEQQVERVNFSEKRNINSDEAQAILTDPRNVQSLISIILNKTTDLDDATRQRLSQEAIDLFILANEKKAYREKVREFLGDPTKINEAFKEVQDKVSQKDRDNKSDELALRLRDAGSMAELDSVFRDAYQQNRDIAKAAMQKAKQQGDDSQKQFIADYEKGLNFFNSFGQQASQLPAEVGAGILETAGSAWEYALQDGTSPYDTFVQSLNDAANDLDSTGQEGAKAEAAAIRQILKDLDAATKATATNKKVKKGTPAASKKNAKAGEEEDSDDDDKKDLAGIAALREKNDKPDTKDSLTKDIEQAALNIFKHDGIAEVKYDKLPKALKDRISKFNEDNPDDMLVVDDILAAALDKIVDGSIEEQGYDISSGDDTEVADYDEGSKRAEDMHNNLRVTFKSDHPSEFRYNLDYRNPYEATASDSMTKEQAAQLNAIRKLLQDYKAYQFVDKNYLGYVAMAYNGHPPIHFLKSTDPAVDGSGGTDSTIFMAIKWDQKAQEAVRKYGFGGKKNVNLMDKVAPIIIDGEQYQIVGVMSLSSQVQSEVSDAFAAVQNAINGELNPQMEAAREAGQPFVLSKKTTQVNQIFTGRLEKRNDEKDPENKVSLYDYMTSNQGNPERGTSTEWENGMDFYFGIIVNGYLNTTDKTEILSRVEQPNDAWMEKNNGHIVMFVPKADGRLYPVRCTRKTVSDWLADVVDGQHKGHELVDSVLAGEKNEYLNNILKYLRTLLNPDATVSDRMNAKIMVSKYFIFGKQSPIHFNDDSVSLTFGKDTDDIEGDTFEEQVHSFFNILANNNIMFSLPAPSIEDVNGRDVIKAGIFEIGLRGFYNFNANFTVDPIDGDGNFVTVEAPESDTDEFHGGAGNRATRVEFDLGDGLKTYTIEGDGTVLENGERVSTEKQNLVSMAMQAEQGRMPQLLQEMLSTLYPKSAEVRKYISDNLSALQGVYIIRADGQDWVYDSRKANHNERLYKLTPEVKKDFVQTIRNFTTKPESMEQIKKLKKEAAPAGSDSGSKENYSKKLKYMGSGTFIVHPSGERSHYSISEATNTFIPTGDIDLLKTSNTEDTLGGRVPATAIGYRVISPGEVKEVEGVFIITKPAKLEYIYRSTVDKGGEKRGPHNASPKMFAGKTLGDMDSKGSPLEALLASNAKSPVVKKVFAALQGAEESGIAINQNKVVQDLKTVLAAKGDKRRRLLSDLIDEINGCH